MSSFFASCAPGFEHLLFAELCELGLLKPKLLTGKEERGGVTFEGGPAELARACRRLTLAERVTLKGKPDRDASGDILARRGWRLESAKAPLRETLAAGLIRASGWDRTSPLLDPFCGSGTIAIEAALMAAGRGPHVPSREFAFEKWKGFEVPAEAPGPSTAPIILASDRDEGAVKAARANAERAGVAGMIEFSVRAVSAIDAPPGPGWVVTNPPYGVRVSEGKEIRTLYAAFGDALRAQCGGWKVALLAPSGPLPSATGLKIKPAFSTLNGGLSVRVWTGKV